MDDKFGVSFSHRKKYCLKLVDMFIPIYNEEEKHTAYVKDYEMNIIIVYSNSLQLKESIISLFLNKPLQCIGIEKDEPFMSVNCNIN